MPSMFQPSLKTTLGAAQEVADSAGASGDSEMVARASKSLSAGFQYLNGKANWDFLLTEANPISVFAPFSVTGITASAGQSSAAAPANHGFKIDDLVALTSGMGLGTRITATAAAGFGFNQALSSTLPAGNNVYTATATRDYYDLPSDWKDSYTVRMLGSLRTLGVARRRAWDRSFGDEFSTSTPQWYDIFSVGTKGKIRLLPPPGGADTLQLRYYRRMTIPSATSTTVTLDIPQDYEGYAIAWAKWHFLTDKGDKERATTWLVLSAEGLKTMLSDQARVPDEDLRFEPGAGMWPNDTTRSTRAIDWNY